MYLGDYRSEPRLAGVCTQQHVTELADSGTRPRYSSAKGSCVWGPSCCPTASTTH